MLALFHSVIFRQMRVLYEKYLSLPQYGNTENPLVTVRTLRIDLIVKVKEQLRFVFSVV